MYDIPLLSHWRLSGFPVDVAILFGSGLIAWMFMVLFFYNFFISSIVESINIGIEPFLISE
jgi:hypothetical protein